MAKQLVGKNSKILMTTFVYRSYYYLFILAVNDIFFCCEVDDYDSAVSTALTHLQFFPDSEDMVNNLDYYR